MKITKKVAKDLIKEALANGKSERIITNDIGRNYLRNMVSLSNEYHETNLTVKSFKDGAIIEIKKPSEFKMSKKEKDSIIESIKRYPCLARFLMNRENPNGWDMPTHTAMLAETSHITRNSTKCVHRNAEDMTKESMV